MDTNARTARARTAEHLTDAERDALMADPEARVRVAALRRADVRDCDIAAGLTDKAVAVRRLAAELAIARGDIGAATFEAMVTDPDLTVRLTALDWTGWEDGGVAADPIDPAAIVERCLQDPEPAVRERVAYPRCLRDPDLIAVVAGDSSAQVRREVAANPLADDAVLAALAQDSAVIVRAAVARNEWARPEHLQAAAAVLTEPGAPALARGVWSDPEVEARTELMDAVLQHPRTPPEVLRALFNRGIPFFAAHEMAEQPNWPADLLLPAALEYAENTLDDDRREEFDRIAALADAALGADWRTCAGGALEMGSSGWGTGRDVSATFDAGAAGAALAEMTRCRIHYLWGFAVASRHTPPEALVAAAELGVEHFEQCKYDLERLAVNPATPVETVRMLVSGPYGVEFWHVLAGSPDAPLDVVELIAGEYDPGLDRPAPPTKDGRPRKHPIIAFGVQGDNIEASRAADNLQIRAARAQRNAPPADR